MGNRKFTDHSKVIGYYEEASDAFMHPSTYAKLSDEARKGFRALIYADRSKAAPKSPEWHDTCPHETRACVQECRDGCRLAKSPVGVTEVDRG